MHDAELRGGQAHPDGIVHDRNHPIRLPLELRAETGDLRGARLQYRIAERADLSQGGDTSLSRLGVQLGQPIVGGSLGADRSLVANAGDLRGVAHRSRV